MKTFEKIKEVAFAFDRELFPGRNLHLSFIIYKGRIIAIGQNSRKTHPINLKNRKINKDGVDISGIKGTCSELATILTVIRRTNVPLNKCTIVNIRINQNNRINNSKPCLSCEKLIKHFDISKIIYSDKNGGFTKIIL